MSNGRAYLLLGPEQGEKAREVQRIRELSSKQAAGTEVEEHRFYAFETPVQEALSLLRSGSLFAGHNLVIIHGVEQIKRKEDLDLLEGYLDHPSDSGTLVLVSDEFRIKDPRSRKDWTKRIPEDNRKIFWEMFENQKRDWLNTFFRRQRVDVDEDAVELILELVDNNTLDLKRAAGRLALFIGEDNRLTADEVETYLYHSKEENVFTLFAKIVTRDFPSSLETMRTIVDSGSSGAIQILAGLVWQFRRLLKLSRLMDRRYGSEEACRAVPLYGKRNQQTYLTGAQNFSTEELQRIISMLARYDAAIREQSGDVQELLLDMCLYHLLHNPAKLSGSVGMK
jgi:DNA polymerase-3 subunit delta